MGLSVLLRPVMPDSELLTLHVETLYVLSSEGDLLTSNLTSPPDVVHRLSS